MSNADLIAAAERYHRRNSHGWEMTECSNAQCRLAVALTAADKRATVAEAKHQRLWERVTREGR